MSVVVLVGAQWGDEGKGKVVDLYTEFADVVVRYQGGNNAGHTLVVGGEKTILHLIPSGVLHNGTECVIAQGVVVDPEILTRELDKVRAKGLLPEDRLLRVSDRAHVIMPYHKQLDALREKRRGGGGIGTTLRGIGPCYEDKVARRGIRVGDLFDPARLREKLEHRADELNAYFGACGENKIDIDATLAWVAQYADKLAPFVCDTARFLQSRLRQHKRIMFEGAQGTMLDIDHGTYPYVTSSNTIAGGACTGAGIGPGTVKQVIGVSKAYATRVGGGPFPSELKDDLGQKMRDIGGEYGATTGRPRRTGWLDMVALKYAVDVNGLSALAITKLDVLSHFDTIHICTGYMLDGERIDYVPMDAGDYDRCDPIWDTMPGWGVDLSGARTFDDLPPQARAYIERIEQMTGVAAYLVSVGPGRGETIVRRKLFEG
jgi:adenylosuccinate synthase